ncbi:hypothetical protein [Ensifer adhaerens]|uniref:hypothetical protein n=1 Tax=Ensifer adhaerens TaxID=106592 RepID=UPI001878F9B7|nr:hypothetical protein [Ensifer adhaerens]MDF8354918.1 hypothetical protein [Ensifer adhaerens]
MKIEKAIKRRLLLALQESGGPSVTPPTTAGFGTRLIEFSVKSELGARVELNYAPKGLAVEIDTPLSPVSKDRDWFHVQVRASRRG